MNKFYFDVRAAWHTRDLLEREYEQMKAYHQLPIPTLTKNIHTYAKQQTLVK